MENAFFRYKSIIVDGLRARNGGGRNVEASLARRILNQMTALGRPVACDRSLTRPRVWETYHPRSSQAPTPLLAMTELKCSTSTIEAWWRSLKHHCLFLHALENVATVRRLVAFYVDEHNRVLPHSAFGGQAPDEMYFGTEDAIRRTSHHARTRRAEHACRPTDQ